MNILAYFLPLIGCLWFGLTSPQCYDWKCYAVILITSWVLTLKLHRFFKRRRTKSIEYLGGYIIAIFHEEAWTEVETYYETEYDEKRQPRQVEKKRYIRHPEEFYFQSSLDTHTYITKSTYYFIAETWGTDEYEDEWRGSDIKGYVRYGQHYVYDDVEGSENERLDRLFTITEPHDYENRIKNSNSIFRFEKVTDVDVIYYGLLDYPPIEDCDAPCILSNCYDVPDDIDREFRVFNATLAPNAEMRLYILLYDADVHDMRTVEKQRSYWQGGNKNEFVVCIGISQKKTVKWARAFSWADEPKLEVAVAAWFREHPDFDLHAFHAWMKANYKMWKRKEFADFDYIQTSLALWQSLTLLAVAAASGIGIAYWLMSL